MTEPENDTLELPLTLFPSSPLASSNDPRTEHAIAPVQVDVAKDQPAGIPNVIHVSTNALVPDKRNIAIYGDEMVDDELVESIRAHGIMDPLRATADGIVLSGHRRLKAAIKLGWASIPVYLTETNADPLLAEEQLLESNRHRSKNNEQLVREFMAYLRIETERAKARMLCGRDPLSKSTEGDTDTEVGNARDIAARKVGMGRGKATHGEVVVLVIDDLRNQGNLDAAERLRTILNKKTVATAHGEAIRQGWIRGEVNRPTPGQQRDDGAREDAAIEHPGSPGGSVAGGHTSPSMELPGVSTPDHANIKTGDGDEPECTIFRDQHLPENEVTAIRRADGDEPGSSFITMAPVPSSYAEPPITASQGYSTAPLATVIPLPKAVDQAQPAERDTGTNLIPTDRIARIIASLTKRDFPGLDDPEIIRCSHSFVESIVAMLNWQARSHPEMSGHDLCRALGMANTKIQIVMKWM